MAHDVASASFAGIPFHVMAPNGRTLDWNRQPTVVSEHIPGSNFAFTQNMGWDHARLTVRAWFDRETDFHRLHALSGTWGTLRLPLRVVTMRADRVFHDMDTDVAEWTDVLLVGIANTELHIDRDVPIECDLTFQTEVRL